MSLRIMLVIYRILISIETKICSDTRLVWFDKRENHFVIKANTQVRFPLS